MQNLADIIENFIVSEMFAEQTPYVLLRRNDLAEKLECAPSQISYVVRARFTPEKGYTVESRRGSGGFIKIERRSEVVEEVSAREIVDHLEEEGIITQREQALLALMLDVVGPKVSQEQQRELIKLACARMGIRMREGV